MIISLMDYRQLETWFRALADANRLRIVALLMKGERCGCEIQVALGLTQPNVSRHLGYLKNAGLIADERRGQRVFYRLASPEPEAARLYDFLRAALPAKRHGTPGGTAAGLRPKQSLVRTRES